MPLIARHQKVKENLEIGQLDFEMNFQSFQKIMLLFTVYIYIETIGKT